MVDYFKTEYAVIWKRDLPYCGQYQCKHYKEDRGYLYCVISESSDICLPMVKHMRSLIERFQKEDAETEEMLENVGIGGPHG